MVFDNPQRKGNYADPLKNRAAHLLGEEVTKGTENRALRPEKVTWIGAIRQTIEDAQVRVREGEETLYFRSYAEGVHMVVTSMGVVKDQRVIITQYAPKLAQHQFEGA